MTAVSHRSPRGKFHADVPQRRGGPAGRVPGDRPGQRHHRGCRPAAAQAHHRRSSRRATGRSPTTPSSSRAPSPSPRRTASRVLPYAKQKVKILKKACGTCKWKTAKKVKTDDNGVFKTAHATPAEQGLAGSGVSKVDHSNGYRQHQGQRVSPTRLLRLTRGQTIVQVSPPPISAASRAVRSASSSLPWPVAIWARAWSSYVARSTWRKMPIGDWCEVARVGEPRDRERRGRVGAVGVVDEQDRRRRRRRRPPRPSRHRWRVSRTRRLAAARPPNRIGSPWTSGMIASALVSGFLIASNAPSLKIGQFW